jgi:hypothetical protein
MTVSVGFDFDQCLTEAYTLVPFILFFEIRLPQALKSSGIDPTIKLRLEKFKDIFYERIAVNEVEVKGHIFRPAILKLLPKLIKLRQEGKIKRMFIYSNNGILQLINAVDHIMALVLKKAPYSVNENELIMEDGHLHVLTPRIHIDNPHRISTEEKDAAGFREKTLHGIQTCLGENINPAELWFFDDSKEHKHLREILGNQYILTEPYRVYLSNQKLAEFFIESFPIEAFTPGNMISSIILTEMNRILPGFRPSGHETRLSLIEKLKKVLRVFSPRGSGRLAGRWNEDHINTDYKKLEQGLNTLMHTSQPKEYTIPTVYKTPIGGRQHVSRRNRFRILRTRRKSRR